MLRAAFLTLLILWVLPAAADAACRRAPDAAVFYESSAVQVSYHGHKEAVACVRATGTERVVRSDVAFFGVELRSVEDDRWLVYSTYDDEDSTDRSRIYTGDFQLDLWTGNSRQLYGKAFVPGAQLVRRRAGLEVAFLDGRTEIADPEPYPDVDDLARQGRRVYWQTWRDDAKTALINPPDAAVAPVVPPLRARRMAKCAARRGARLVARFQRLVVTRKGKDTRVCLEGRTTRLGDVRDVRPLSARELAYIRPGRAGSVDAATGHKRELPRAGGPLVAQGRTIVAQDRHGVLRSWSRGRRPRVLTTKPATDVAVSDDFVYWLAADGTPRSKDLTP